MKKLVQALKYVQIDTQKHIVHIIDEKGKNQAHNLKYNKRLCVDVFYVKGVMYTVGIEWLEYSIFAIDKGILTSTTNKELTGTVNQLMEKGFMFTPNHFK